MIIHLSIKVFQIERKLCSRFFVLTSAVDIWCDLKTKMIIHVFVDTLF